MKKDIYIIFSIAIIISLCILSLTFYFVNQELQNEIKQQKEKLDILTKENEQINSDNVRYKMMYEEAKEMYELFIDCAENGGAACDQPRA